MFRIFETEGFREDMEQDFEGRAAKIRKKLQDFIYPQLKLSPEYGPNIKMLRGFDPPVWRYRIGSYRFFYQIDKTDLIVIMTAAEHRRQSYRG